MSGFGLGGFGSGFLQGFQAMGQNFAQRGILQAERQNQARADRKMALEEELDRLREGRAARESESVIALRGSQKEGLDTRNELDKLTLPSEVEAAALKPRQIASQIGHLDAGTAGLNANTDLATQALPANVRKATADAAGAEAQARLTSAQADEVPANSQSARKVQTAQADNLTKSAEQTGVETDIKRVERKKSDQLDAYRARLSDDWDKLDRGDADAAAFERLNRVRPLIDLAAQPHYEQDVGTVFSGLTAAAQASGPQGDMSRGLDILNQPEILSAMNRTVGPIINQTKGRLTTEGGRFVVTGSNIQRLVKHPTENRLGVVLTVDEAVPEERRARLEEELRTAAPERQAQIRQELRGRQRETFLTDQRVPVGQGGKTRWFSPEEMQKLVMGLKGVGDLRAAHPELATNLGRLRDQLDRGEVPGAADDDKAFDRQIKIGEYNMKVIDTGLRVKQDKRADQKEPREVSDNSYKEAATLIDKELGSVDSWGGVSFQGEAGQRASAEKIMVRKVLKQNPELTGAEAVEEARARMPKQSMAAPLAQSGVKSTGTGQKSYRSLFLSK